MGGSARGPARSVSRRLLVAGAAAAAVGGAAGCQSAGAKQVDAKAKGASPTLLPEVKVPPKAEIAVTPKHEAGDVGVDEAVQVNASGGRLRKVSLKDADGTAVPGSFDDKRRTWRAKGQLIPERTYVINAKAANIDGKITETESTFETAPPSEVVGTDIVPLDGQTVGVGMPIVVKFSEPVQDRAAVQDRLSVETSKSVEGAWHWFSDSEVHYRPESYWPANTEVTLKLPFKDFQYGEGAWGIKDKTRKFTIGRSVVTKVDLKRTFTAKVYVDGKHARTIPVTGGKENWETRKGTKLVLAKRRNINFTNEAIGAEEEYDLTSAYALRVTWTGEFLHTAQWSLNNLGKRNSSHGCVGMNKPNSKWLWNISQVGDPMEFDSTGSQMPETGNGYGDWNMSWDEWKAGSAA